MICGLIVLIACLPVLMYLKELCHEIQPKLGNYKMPVKLGET